MRNFNDMNQDDRYNCNMEGTDTGTKGDTQEEVTESTWKRRGKKIAIGAGIAAAGAAVGAGAMYMATRTKAVVEEVVSE